MIKILLRNENIAIFFNEENIKYIIGLNEELISKYFECMNKQLKNSVRCVNEPITNSSNFYMDYINVKDITFLFSLLNDEELTDEICAIAVSNGLDIKLVPEEKLTINFYIILISENIENIENIKLSAKDSIL